MTRQFEIFQLKTHHNRGLFIFARHLGDDHNFNVPDGSQLGDLPISHFATERDVFIFRPLNIEHLFDKRSKEGQVVLLVTFN
jgi:hypothetical protein